MLHLGYTHPTTPTRHRTDKCKIVSPTRVMPIHHHHHIKIRVVVCPLVFPFVRCCLVIDRVHLEKAVVVLSPERKTEVVGVEEEIVMIAMRVDLVLHHERDAVHRTIRMLQQSPRLWIEIG